MITLNDLRKRYKDAEVLRGLTLEIPAGELFAFLGPNGAGKTTTIRILNGLTRKTSGRAQLNGFDIDEQPLLAKRQAGLAPQSVNLDMELSVVQNLLIHCRLYGLDRPLRATRIEELLDLVGLSDRRHQSVAKLSGGMKRRLLLARALAHGPRILFLDEPTVGLDPGMRRRIWALIKRLQREGTTIFLCTHHIEEAEFLADRVAFVDQGSLVALDTPTRLMATLGGWALDRLEGDEMRSEYFATAEEARERAAVAETGFTVRRVNLEDAFLALTGRRIQ